ncbi:DUF6415 family natural product biosynthesis protein [Streptomyces sp. N2-109]|uniref:DUF6415 family natural product biosynthesis protein n=1 Tax=Streptomyces gossypii TaxID=2883101 RepID=A0ABT2JYJ6_9ACTN|nr:DUF6415 family natural product biosynthesis protein [Streptomyces gossypii]MCT2592519.1 DUF6415 family natural product biosynthesis protein [Streptomyces gossypii]
MSSTAPEHAPAPVPADALRALIDRALETLALPGRPELAALERELRQYAEQLLPDAEAVVEGLWRGSLSWNLRRGRLEAIRRLLGQAPGADPLTAHVQVRHLVADCRVLLGYLEEHR